MRSFCFGVTFEVLSWLEKKFLALGMESDYLGEVERRGEEIVVVFETLPSLITIAQGFSMVVLCSSSSSWKPLAATALVNPAANSICCSQSMHILEEALVKLKLQEVSYLSHRPQQSLKSVAAEMFLAENIQQMEFAFAVLRRLFFQLFQPVKKIAIVLHGF